MKYLSLVLWICLLTMSFVGCTSNEKKVKQTQEIQEVVVLDDGYETSEDGAVIIDDQDYDGKVITVAAQQTEESVKSGKDGSQIKIMYDGFGNKTVTRMFHDHPLITGIVTRISSTGIKKAYLYTKDGLVKEISESVADVVETASGNEIAKQTGVFALQKNDVYNPMLAKAETEESDELNKDVLEFNYVDPQPIQFNPQPKLETVKPKQVEIAKEEKQKETEMLTNNTFMNEYDVKVESVSKVKSNGSRKGNK